MKNQADSLNITASVLISISFLFLLIIGSIADHAYTIAGACLLIPSIAFTIVAIFTHRLFNIGALIFNIISNFITTFLIPIYSYDIEYYTFLRISVPLVFYVLLSISNILLLIYIFLSQQESISPRKNTSKGHNNDFDKCMSELRELKSVYDYGILSQSEFEIQKNNILNKYDMPIEAQPQAYRTDIKQNLNFNSIQSDSHEEYRCGNGINLLIKSGTYSFIQTEGKKILFGGTYKYSEDRTHIYLYRNNAPTITLKICSDGLELPSGGKYKKI